jgi:nucleoside phosphorylase
MDQYETQIAPLAAEIQLMDMEAFGYFQTAAKLDIPIVAIKAGIWHFNQKRRQ